MFRAYAKINLGLLVLDKRPDGYHNIETVFHRVDLYDEIEFSQSPSIQLSCSSDTIPLDHSNICYKAASLLQSYLKTDKGVHIAINKKIPVGAGLGGGSSDAATALLNLPGFWNTSVDRHAMHDLAVQLGSDVPYFLEKRSALGRGRGDILEYFDLEIPYFILLCNPNIHIATAWAYNRVKPTRAGYERSIKDILLDEMHQPEQLGKDLCNDFEDPVFKAYPEVKRIKEAMLSVGANFALMSGSGSSVYGFFEDGKEAAAASESLQAAGCKTFLTRPHFNI